MIVTVSINIETEDHRGRRKTVWTRSVSEEGSLPSHLALQELFTIAHAQIQPPRPEMQTTHD